MTHAAPDLIVHGGTIRSLDDDHPCPDVMTVREGRVLELGGSELLDDAGDARRLDLQGGTVLPGLIDSHSHFLGLGQFMERVDLRNASCFEEVLERVHVAVSTAEPGEVIEGWGWNHESWPERSFPHHARLSTLSPENPVLLRRVDGHATLANARAMELSSITAASVSPAGGEIRRDAAGKPTGLFIDTAARLLLSPPSPDSKTRLRQAKLAEAACFRAGLTGAVDAGVTEAEVGFYEKAHERGELDIRIQAMLIADFEEGGRPAPWLAARLARGPVVGAHDGRLSVTAVKIFFDGALGSRGAALLEPYSDEPENQGLMQLAREELTRRVTVIHEAGFQAAVHAIGDAANRVVLDVYEEVLGEAAPTMDHRFRVEHAQILSPQDIPRFAALGVTAAVQPTHATSDIDMAESRLGAHRMPGAYAWRKLVESGARIALGSDFPIESENPLWGIYSAVTRQDHEGRPEGGWHPSERLTPEEALRGFTVDAAWAGFLEGEVGSLTPGKRADFAVFPSDPLQVPPRELVELEVESTWLSGAAVHRRDQSNR